MSRVGRWAGPLPWCGAGRPKAPRGCPAPFRHDTGRGSMGRRAARGPGSARPECSAPGRSAEAGGEGEEATAREDVVTGADGLERGRCGAIPVDAAAVAGRVAGPPPPPDVPTEPDVPRSLASVSRLLICGRSDLLYFRSHEVNLHCGSRALLRRYECDFLPAVTVGRNTTEMMRSEGSFLDRKEAHALSLGPAQAGSNQTGRARGSERANHSPCAMSLTRRCPSSA